MTMISSNLEHNCYWMWLLKFSQLSGQLYYLELDFILSSKPSEIPRCFLLKLLSRQMTFINCVASQPKFGVLCLSLLNVHGVAKSWTQLIDFPFPCWMYSLTSSLFLWLWLCICFSDLPSTVSSTNLISTLSIFFFLIQVIDTNVGQRKAKDRVQRHLARGKPSRWPWSRLSK